MPADTHPEAARATASAGAAWGVSALHASQSWEAAVDGVLATLQPHGRPDLALAFVDSRFGDGYAQIVERLAEGLGAAHLLGCTGQSVIGAAHEAEEQPAVSVLALRLPGARFTALPLVPGAATEGQAEALANPGVGLWLLFADPYSVATENLVAGLEKRRPGIVLLGGMASAHNGARGTAVFLDGVVHDRGAVLLGVEGVEAHVVVAQGAEPIGQPWTVTGCEQNSLQSVGSRPALDVLRETLEGLEPEARERAQRNLLVGLAMDEYKEAHGRGDFLIRNLLGVDRESQALAINALPRLGQTVQFQFRDAAAADDDLRAQLAACAQRLPPTRAVMGALLCACNGRGKGLFGVPHHDAGVLAEVLGPVPTAGFFCAGEIGPVGGRNFVHGFTASIVLLTAARA